MPVARFTCHQLLPGHCLLNKDDALSIDTKIHVGSVILIHTDDFSCMCIVDEIIDSTISICNPQVVTQTSLGTSVNIRENCNVQISIEKWLTPEQLKTAPIASSVVIRMMTDQGTMQILPTDTSARESIVHALRCHIPVSEGFSILTPARAQGCAVVLRCSPSVPLVRITFDTSITFDNNKQNIRQQKPKASETCTRQTTETHFYSQAYTHLYELLVWPILYQKECHAIPSLVSPRGVLLHGLPGTGKTTAIHNIVREITKYTYTPCTLIEWSKIATSGKSDDESLRECFRNAERFLAEYPSGEARAVVFLDEIDAICPKRGPHDATSSRTVAQLLTLMDGIQGASRYIAIVAATNLVNQLDSALRRPGRFDREILFTPPNKDERVMILRYYLRERALQPPLDPVAFENWLDGQADRCVGFVGADLRAVVDVIDPSQPFLESWDRAVGQIGKAGMMRQNVFKTVSARIQIGGYHHVQRELVRAIDWPKIYASKLKEMNISPPRGILLHGPPGCSKTSMAKAAASRCGYAFLSVSSAQVYSPFVGEAEKMIRDVFQSARAAKPAIIFFDELDAIVGKRDVENSKMNLQGRILATMLNEMDGVVSSEGILVMGATNRIDMIDDALLRPGRFDRLIEVPLPSFDDRIEILKIHLQHVSFENCDSSVPDRVLEQLATSMNGYNGAEIQNHCRESCMNAIRQGRDYMIIDDLMID